MEESTPSARFTKVEWRHRTLRFQTTGVNRGLRPFHAPTLDARSWVPSSAYQGHAARAAAGMAQPEEGAQDIGEALNIFLLAWKLVLQAGRCALEYYPEGARTRLERSIEVTAQRNALFPSEGDGPNLKQSFALASGNYGDQEWSPVIHQTAGYQLASGSPFLVSPLIVQFERCLFSASKDTAGVGAKHFLHPRRSRSPTSIPSFSYQDILQHRQPRGAFFPLRGYGTFRTERCQDLYGDEPPKDQSCRKRTDKRSRPC